VALSTAGVASRRAAEDIIRDGRVQVNGQTVELPQFMVDGKRDKVVVDGRPLNTVSTHLYYFAVNKPKGCAPTRPTHTCPSARSVRGVRGAAGCGQWALTRAHGWSALGVGCTQVRLL
jgi:16S rRNA U516 pseudouridylate synthase RsuA-like enzyme